VKHTVHYFESHMCMSRSAMFLYIAEPLLDDAKQTQRNVGRYGPRYVAVSKRNLRPALGSKFLAEGPTPAIRPNLASVEECS